MTFLNPLVLFGLIAAGIPVLLHLLQLRKMKRVDFSSVRFLKEIQHASAKRVKLRDYLLLILRTLAIAALVLAFSRPAVKGFLGSNSRTSAVLIIDNSPSTTARNEYGKISNQIRNVSEQLLGSLRSGDNAGVVFTSSAADTGQVSGSLNPRSLVAAISRSEPSSISGGYTAAIGRALSALRNSEYAEREIYLVGDMQQSEFRNPSGMEVPKDARIFFVRTKESPNDNLSVSNVKLASPVVQVNSPAKVEATVCNNDGSDKSGVIVALYIDGKKVAQSVANVGAGLSRSVGLAFSVASSGFHKGMVRIDDNSIQSDNTYYFSFYAVRQLKVLIVSSGPDNDFVGSAVRSVMDTSTAVDARTVTPGRFTYADLAGTDVVVAESYPAGRGSIGAAQAFDAKLSSFVEGGGGAILFGPSQDAVDAFAHLIAELRVGSLKGILSGGGFAAVEHVDASNDFFSGIFSTGKSAQRLKSLLVTKVYRGVDISADPSTSVLMSTSAGPFIMSRQSGSGFVFVIACAADTASSDFPLSPLFPVVVQRALFYSSAVAHRPIQVYAGGEVNYRYSGGGLNSAVLVSPSGNRSDYVPEFVGGTARFTFHHLNTPGTYTLMGAGPLCQISVNIDPRESNLRQETEAGMKKYTQKIGFAGENVFIVPAGKNSSAVIERLRRGEDLSSFFAAAALLFLIGEIFVSRMKTIS